MAACKIASVKPTLEKLNGIDPLAYIVSANLARRDMTKGQKAMAYAKIYPEGSKGGRGKRNLDETSTFSNKRLQIARTASGATISLPRCLARMGSEAKLDLSLVFFWDIVGCGGL